MHRLVSAAAIALSLVSTAASAAPARSKAAAKAQKPAGARVTARRAARPDAAVSAVNAVSAGGARLPQLAMARETAVAPHAHGKAAGKPSARRPCVRDPIAIARISGTEEERFSLTRCDGSPAPLALEHLSVMARPGSAARPEKTIAELVKAKGENIAPGVRRLDARLVERLQLVVDHFAKANKPLKMTLVSGYRPTSTGSYHATGQALDFRLDGTTNEALVTFCKTLPDTGCGYYPNSSFIHLDVRAPGTGHVTWIDASGPGETPRYVASWPPPKSLPMPAPSRAPVPGEIAASDPSSLAPLPADEHGPAIADPIEKMAPSEAASIAAPNEPLDPPAHDQEGAF